MKTYLLAIKNKLSRLSRKKAVSLIIVTLILILFPRQALLFANGLLECSAVIIGVIYARYWGIFNYMPEGKSKCSVPGIGGGDYCDDSNDDAEKYQHEVDLGFH